MIELLVRADPARGHATEATRLRAKLDERIGLAAPLRPARHRAGRPWLIAVAFFAVVIGLALPVLLTREQASILVPNAGATADLPGVESVTTLGSEGIQTHAVDGDTIWVLSSLAHELQRVSATSGRIERTYRIDPYAEGIVIGAGFLWLSGYDQGGELHRFDPVAGRIDLTIPLGGQPGWSHWFGGHLWVSSDQGELLQVAPNGEVVSRSVGELKGEGLGYLWVNDPETGLISSLAEDGTRGGIVIPTYEGLDTMSGSGVRSVTEAGGYLWLLDGDFPWGTNVSRFAPESGELSSFASLTFGLLGIAEHDGYLWITSNKDHVLFRIDPAGGETRRYPLPGKVGGVFEADGDLWVTLYQPGTLVRLDTNADLLEMADTVADDWDRFPHRFICTGTADTENPTILLEPMDWIDYGSWSVIQAELSQEGYLVCTNGYVEGEVAPAKRAADLQEALAAAGIDGPFVLVANGDGVHTMRLFANERDDVAGVVMVDPMPLGFQGFLDSALGDGGHPPWLDLDSAVSESLADFGGVPLVVIGQDPQAVFLSDQYIDYAGVETANQVNDYWQAGLDFYAGLSNDANRLVARGTGFERVLWDQPDLVIERILGVAELTQG